MPSSSSLSLPDTHIHIIPPSYLSALKAHPDPSGLGTPVYSDDLLKTFLTSLNITHPILSVTTPGAAGLLGPTPEGRNLTRVMNIEVSQTIDELRGEGWYAGFFASLPDFRDQEGVLQELEWVFEQEKKASGIVVFTNYGDNIVADTIFRPIWEKLNAHKALVFVHPTGYPSTPQEVANILPEAVIDFPHATTRAAMDLILTGTIQASPDIDIILSHAGGTLPFVAPRALAVFDVPEIVEHLPVTKEQALENAKRFYYDLALSCSPVQLTALLMHTNASRITFGTDFPYAPIDAIYAGAASYMNFVKSNGDLGNSIRPEALMQNAKGLVEKHWFANNSVPVGDGGGSDETEGGVTGRFLVEEKREGSGLTHRKDHNSFVDMPAVVVMTGLVAILWLVFAASKKIRKPSWVRGIGTN